VLWFAAVCFLIFWLVGLILGRGGNSGRHNFYRW
jgi:hypothetical protein